jgi:hypothetical protein
VAGVVVMPPVAGCAEPKRPPPVGVLVLAAGCVEPKNPPPVVFAAGGLVPIQHSSHRILSNVERRDMNVQE